MSHYSQSSAAPKKTMKKIDKNVSDEEFKANYTPNVLKK